MLKTRKSNLCYIFFLMIVVPIVFLLLFSSKNSNKNAESLTSNDYDKVFAIGSYNYKITNCIYSSDGSQLAFYYKSALRVTEAKNSAPKIVSVLLYDDKGREKEVKFTVKKVSNEEFKVTCDNVSNDFSYIKIKIKSKENDFQEPDKVDEFGDVIKGEYREGKSLDYYINIDVRDIPDLSEDDFKKYVPKKVTTTATTTSISTYNTTVSVTQNSTITTTTTTTITKATTTAKTTTKSSDSSKTKS